MTGCGFIDLRSFLDKITLETGVGQVSAISSIRASNLTEGCISLKSINFEPRLPPGGSVRNCTAVLLSIDGSIEIQSLQLELSIASKALGSSCTGQYLDAQEWSDQGKLVVIGTEDSEALVYRIPKLREENIVIVDFTRHSLTLKLKDLPKLTRPSFHFIIAENDDPEPVDDSAWFAVDQNHDYILEQF